MTHDICTWPIYILLLLLSLLYMWVCSERTHIIHFTPVFCAFVSDNAEGLRQVRFSRAHIRIVYVYIMHTYTCVWDCCSLYIYTSQQPTPHPHPLMFDGIFAARTTRVCVYSARISYIIISIETAHTNAGYHKSTQLEYIYISMFCTVLYIPCANFASLSIYTLYRENFHIIAPSLYGSDELTPSASTILDSAIILMLRWNELSLLYTRVTEASLDKRQVLSFWEI